MAEKCRKHNYLYDRLLPGHLIIKVKLRSPRNLCDHVYPGHSGIPGRKRALVSKHLEPGLIAVKLPTSGYAIAAEVQGKSKRGDMRVGRRKSTGCVFLQAALRRRLWIVFRPFGIFGKPLSFAV